MAWRSSGINNNEMIDNLKRFGVISSGVIENGFRAVDRRHFVPDGNEALAHSDQPLKEGNIHISAPHIYGAALEALELKQNSTLSFLNIGSGTGYLSAIVAEILGPKSLNFGVEIHQDVIDHCRSSLKAWSSSHGSTNAPRSHPQIIRGNGLCISDAVGESTLGFDRIYIGAAIERGNLLHISKLLSPGGILVGPVDGNLVKVIRNEGERNTSLTTTRRDDSSGESGDDDEEGDGIDNGFALQVLSGVRFASLLIRPALNTVIPAQSWSPEEHQYFPDAFQKASSELMMCANSDYMQPLPPKPNPEERVNLSAVLPKSLWVEVLSFTHRRWFAPDRNKAEYLKTRLQEEKDKATKAEQARLDLEARCQVAERERDAYRLLARRWQSRLQAVLEEQQRDVASSSGYRASASDALQAELGGDEDEDSEEDDDAAMMDEDYSSSGGYAALSHDRSMEDVDDGDDGHDGIEKGEDDEAYFSCNQACHESIADADDDSVEMSDVEDGLEPADNAQMMTGAVDDVESQGKVRAVSIASEDL